MTTNLLHLLHQKGDIPVHRHLSKKLRKAAGVQDLLQRTNTDVGEAGNQVQDHHQDHHLILQGTDIQEGGEGACPDLQGTPGGVDHFN